ncbi:MAG: response regulator [Actinomycetales bacterium]
MSESIRVLVVEDEPMMADAHASYVGRVPGFEVVRVAVTLREAVQSVIRDRVQLVLLDLNLPDGHGLDLVRSIRGSGREVDILAITAARETHLVRAAISLGVVGYVLKPFTFAHLKERLQSYADFRNQVSGEQATTQLEVDRMLQDLHRPPGPAAMPKGLTSQVLCDVEQVLREPAWADGASASQVAEAIGASRVTARRYLEHLVAGGAVERGQRLGRTGRPEVTFRWLFT